MFEFESGIFIQYATDLSAKLSNLYLLNLSKQLKFSVLPLILPVFPSWVDEIAKSRPDMNIKVTAFTESEK